MFDPNLSELEIEIVIDGKSEAVYRFSTFPLDIGRDSSCHLSICHDVIARRLCTVWVEPNGTIRLEERPNLTNPIWVDGERVAGGISKDCLHISVGPVELFFSVWNTNTPRPQNEKRERTGAKKKRLVAALGGVLIVGLVFFCATFAMGTILKRGSLHSQITRQDFPKELQFEKKTVESSTPQTAEFIKRVAQDAYFRIPIQISNRRHAIELMMSAVEIEKASRGSSEVTQRQLNRWKTALNRAYRLQIISFFSAQKNDDPHQIIRSAKKLQQYLERQAPKLTRQLDNLIMETVAE